MPDIERVSVSNLLERAVDHNTWPVPFDPNLRQGLHWCGGGMLVAIPVGMLGAPVLSSLTYDGVFFFLGPLAVALLDLLRSPVAIFVNVAALALFVLLYWQSEQLTQADIAWQQLGFGLIVVGAIDIFAMTLPLAIVALNALIWIVLIGLVLAAIAAVSFAASLLQ